MKSEIKIIEDAGAPNDFLLLNLHRLPIVKTRDFEVTKIESVFDTDRDVVRITVSGTLPTYAYIGNLTNS